MDGLIQTESAMVTMGGSGDVGRDMDQELAGQIRARLLACGLNLVEEADFQKNLALREELYRTEGENYFTGNLLIPEDMDVIAL